jgi:hypothetical protein
MLTPAIPSWTPILDLEKPLPSSSRFSDLRWWQAVLIGFMICIALPAASIAVTEYSPGAAHYLERIDRIIEALFDSFGTNGVIWILFLFWVLLIGALTIHELGHLLAGKLVGFPASGLIVGPFVASRSSGKWRLRFQKFTGLHGLAIVHIPKVRRLRSKLARFSVGGMLANLLSGGIILLLLMFGAFDQLSSGLRSAATLFVVLSFWLFVGNAVPRRSRQIGFTDGARLLMLASSRKQARRWFSLIALQIEARSGVKAKCWKQTWIRAATCDDDGSRDALTGAWMKYQSIVGGNDADEAAKWLEICLKNSTMGGGAFRQLLIAEASVFQAWFRRDRRKAETWFLKLPKSMAPAPVTLVRAKVALDCVCQRHEQMAANWNEGMKLIQGFPLTVRTASETSWREWKVEIDKRFEVDASRRS